MGPGLWAAVLALGLVLGAAWAQPIFPSIANRPFIRECVRVHNEFRRRVVPAASNMRQMVVWDKSYKLGCAVVFCEEAGGIRNAANFICNYAPAGHFLRRPYKEGVPCSQCSKGDICRYKLCKNAERDKIIYYSRWYPPWEFRIVCDEACITLVVSRAVLMFLGLLIAFLIKKHFPDMDMSI